jgi:hypothetical protein
LLNQSCISRMRRYGISLLLRGDAGAVDKPRVI